MLTPKLSGSHATHAMVKSGRISKMRPEISVTGDENMKLVLDLQWKWIDSCLTKT